MTGLLANGWWMSEVPEGHLPDCAEGRQGGAIANLFYIVLSEKEQQHRPL